MGAIIGIIGLLFLVFAFMEYYYVVLPIIGGLLLIAGLIYFFIMKDITYSTGCGIISTLFFIASTILISVGDVFYYSQGVYVKYDGKTAYSNKNSHYFDLWSMDSDTYCFILVGIAIMLLAAILLFLTARTKGKTKLTVLTSSICGLTVGGFIFYLLGLLIGEPSATSSSASGGNLWVGNIQQSGLATCGVISLICAIIGVLIVISSVVKTLKPFVEQNQAPD